MGFWVKQLGLSDKKRSTSWNRFQNQTNIELIMNRQFWSHIFVIGSNYWVKGQSCCFYAYFHGLILFFIVQYIKRVMNARKLWKESRIPWKYVPKNNIIDCAPLSNKILNNSIDTVNHNPRTEWKRKQVGKYILWWKFCYREEK